MTDKELHKLNRAELLELLLDQSREIEALHTRIDDLQAQLDEKNLIISESGSIAEAALELNHIFEDAQRAADMYLDNVIALARKKAEDLGVTLKEDVHPSFSHRD